MPLKLVLYPDPILKRRAAPLTKIDDDVRSRVREMFDLLYREHGVGLAAPQVGWSTRLFIANPKGEQDPASEQIYINPKIVVAEGEIREEEGCLSIPNVRGLVTRSQKLKVVSQNLAGEVIEEECQDLKSRIIQHELDHLDGILFIVRLGFADKLRIKRKLRDLEEESGAGSGSK